MGIEFLVQLSAFIQKAPNTVTSTPNLQVTTYPQSHTQASVRMLRGSIECQTLTLHILTGTKARKGDGDGYLVALV